MSAPVRHVHAWGPISGWVGRYRCAECLVVGRRQTVAELELGSRTGEPIIPYRCHARSDGEVCGQPAVHVTRYKLTSRCAQHVKRPRDK